MKRLFIAALSLMATGCGIYNRYERPDSVQVEADSLYRTENAPDTTSSLASLKWEELFTDPYLQSLIRRGLEANTDLQTAVLRVEEAQATLRSSRLAYLPSVQLDPQVRSPATTEAKHKRHILSVVLHRGKSTCSAN